MHTKYLNLTKSVLFPLLAIGLLWWAYSKINFDELLDALKSANYFWVGLSFVAGVISHWLRALRWKLAIEPLGYDVRVRTGFYAVMTGYLINIVTPRLGEVARCAMYNRTDKVPVDKLIGTVFTERIFDLIITLLITIAVVLLQLELIGDFLQDIFSRQDGSSRFLKLAIILVVGIGGLIAYWMISRYFKPEKRSPWMNKVFGFVDGLLDGAKTIFKLKKPLLFILYTLLIWVMYFFMSYLIFFALDGTSHLGIDAGLTTVVMATVAVIVPAPGGFGSYHYFVPLGLGLFNIDLGTATAYATLSHTTQMVMIATVGGLCVFLGGIEKRKQTRMEGEEAGA
ncbi:MAG: flippase-like domain-containing protein [Bacteroidetes bacterium]|nr:flippase-like domain-containing protein [Bacteroidota bacterium]